MFIIPINGENVKVKRSRRLARSSSLMALFALETQFLEALERKGKDKYLHKLHSFCIFTNFSSIDRIFFLLDDMKNIINSQSLLKYT